MRPESSADRLIRVLLVLACVALSFAIAAFVVHLIRSFSTIVVIVVGSVFLIYLIAPAIAWLQRFMKKHWAVALALVGLVAIFVLFALIIVPPLVNQAAQFAAALPGAAARATIALRDPNGGLARLLPSSIRNELAHLPERMFSIMARYAVTLGKQGFTAVVSGVGLLLLFIIIPVLAAYALFDYPELQRGLLGFVPKDRRPQAIAIMHDVNEVIGAFVRGQLLDCLIVGAMIGVWLMITGVPFALVIAVAAGVLNLIPYVGAIAGFIPSVLLALAYNGWQNALIVAVGFAHHPADRWRLHRAADHEIERQAFSGDHHLVNRHVRIALRHHRRVCRGADRGDPSRFQVAFRPESLTGGNRNRSPSRLTANEVSRGRRLVPGRTPALKPEPACGHDEQGEYRRERQRVQVHHTPECLDEVFTEKICA